MTQRDDPLHLAIAPLGLQSEDFSVTFLSP
jgi:hypothetical protein